MSYRYNVKDDWWTPVESLEQITFKNVLKEIYPIVTHGHLSQGGLPICFCCLQSYYSSKREYSFLPPWTSTASMSYLSSYPQYSDNGWCILTWLDWMKIHWNHRGECWANWSVSKTLNPSQAHFLYILLIIFLAVLIWSFKILMTWPKQKGHD